MLRVITMKASRVFLPLTVFGCIANATSACAFDGHRGFAASHPFHADPNHAWNRLHHVLWHRTGPDDQEYGYDRLDPLLWPGTTHLLTGPSHEAAVDSLNSFVSRNADSLIQDPLRRAMFHRDLWAVFNWVVGEHLVGPSLSADEVARAQEALARPLAQLIRRLAISSEQIRALADNYESAVDAKVFAADYVGEHLAWGGRAAIHRKKKNVRSMNRLAVVIGSRVALDAFLFRQPTPSLAFWLSREVVASRTLALQLASKILRAECLVLLQSAVSTDPESLEAAVNTPSIAVRGRPRPRCRRGPRLAVHRR
jgi:hypothetical protein